MPSGRGPSPKRLALERELARLSPPPAHNALPAPYPNLPAVPRVIIDSEQPFLLFSKGFFDLFVKKTTGTFERLLSNWSIFLMYEKQNFSGQGASSADNNWAQLCLGAENGNQAAVDKMLWIENVIAAQKKSFDIHYPTHKLPVPEVPPANEARYLSNVSTSSSLAAPSVSELIVDRVSSYHAASSNISGATQPPVLSSAANDEAFMETAFTSRHDAPSKNKAALMAYGLDRSSHNYARSQQMYTSSSGGMEIENQGANSFANGGLDPSPVSQFHGDYAHGFALYAAPGPASTLGFPYVGQQNSIPCIVITQTSHTITHDQPVNTALHLLTAFDSILHEMGESDAAERLLALSEDARENLMSDEAALETFFDVLPGIRIDTAKFELEVVRELADTVIASAEQRHVHRSNTWALVPKFFDRIRNAVGQAQMGSVSCVDLPVGSKKRAFDAFDDVILEGDFNVAHDSQARKRTRFEPLEIGNGVASFLQEEESQPGGALSGTASPDSPWSW